MKSEVRLQVLLSQELRRVTAPAGLWREVERSLDAAAPGGRAHASWSVHPVWVIAAAFGVLVCLTPVIYVSPMTRAQRELDLGPYLAPVQNASLTENASAAIAQAPPRFENANSEVAISPVAGYQIAAQRVANVGQETVRQVVLTAAGSVVSLFISPPKVRLDARPNHWIDTRLEGVSCKRLNCQRVQTAQFPCFQQTCVLICKTCSERAMSTLMNEVAAIR